MDTKVTKLTKKKSSEADNTMPSHALSVQVQIQFFLVSLVSLVVGKSSSC
jgi:hypothetical protein